MSVNGGRAIFQRSGITSEGDVKAAVERAVKELGKLDVIYNNAGLVEAGIEYTTIEDWDRTQAVLLRGVFLGMKHQYPRYARPAAVR